VRNGGKSREEGVKGEDEEERRKRAALLNPTHDVNPSGSGFAEKGGHLNPSQNGFNKKKEPRGETNALKDKKNPIVVNRVEGFGRVK